MEKLNQCAIASYYLGSMEGAETEGHIVHRLRTVGWRIDRSFAEDAFDTVYEYTSGVPHKINLLCH